MTARESWLRSTDDDKWAAAMVACRHPAGFCGADGYCHYGDCFKRQTSVATLEKMNSLQQEIEMLKLRIEHLESRIPDEDQ